MADVQTATLLIRRGGRKGRRFTLKGEPFRIGQDASCDLVLKDEFVSSIHTIIELRGEQWVATNRGVNGTLVNAVAVQGSRALATGDIVQVGGETLLQFDLKAAPARAKKAKADAGTGGAATPLLQRPIVLGAIGVYLLLMVGAFVFFSGISLDGGTALTAQGREALLAETRSFMLTDPGLVAGSGRVLPTDPDADPAAAYYAALMARVEGDAGETERRVDALIGRVDSALVQAWLHEQQDKLELARDQYARITRMVPSLRSPITKHSVARIAELESRIDSVWR